MNDKQFLQKMSQHRRLKIKEQQVLKLLEDEYEKRFGINPSDNNDEYWIDTFHCGVGDFNIEDMTENAILYSQN